MISTKPAFALRSTSVLLLSILMAACGGGSDDGTATPPVTPPVLPPTLSLPGCVAAPNPLHDITAVQGTGSLSPLVDAMVTVRGVVTANFQADAQLKGFFIQQPVADADPLTSEGLFIYAPGAAPISVGDYVQASGKVAEYKSGSASAERLTELSEITQLSVCGKGPAIAPKLLKLPLASATELEAVEGMLVEFQQPLTVTEVHKLGQYGELKLSAGGRLFQPNNHPSDAPREQIVAANALASIMLDDGATAAYPATIPYLSAAGIEGTRRVGDTLAGLRGVVTWGADAYRIHPVDAPLFTQANPRPVAPAEVGGTLRAGSLNVLNYFTSLTLRGANSPQEFTRQRDKLVAAIVGLNADVLGLMEIENNGVLAVADLVEGVNAKLGVGTYAFIDSGKPGTDEIKVSAIYKPSRVKPLGNPVVPTGPGFSVATGLRPPLAQRFAALDNHGGFWMIVNHLKSKGSCPSGVGNPDQDQGQGCWNVSRTAQATALVNWVDGLRTSSGEADVLMVGDFNSYLNEDPIKILEAAGHEELIRRLPPAERYSYVFDGESGVLDHAMASSSLASQVSGITVWHINADEPNALDYNLEDRKDDRYAATPYRSSDHDPVLVGLTLHADTVFSLPTLSATLPTTGTSGAAVSVTGIAAVDGSTLSIDWGDGIQEALAVTATAANHTYAAAGNYALVLRLTDAAGANAQRSATVTISAPPPTGGTTELFFSEYTEGTASNKALEIYNPTGADVDLSAYAVKLYSNGSVTAGITQSLTGTLPAGGVLVLLNKDFTQSKALPGALISNATNFNGDDAVTLEKLGTVIDAIGQAGFRPSGAWTTGEAYSTANKTLRRKPGIVHGSVPPAAPAPWDISIEWNVFDVDNFDGLGLHTAN